MTRDGCESNTILMESCLAGYDDIVAKIMQKCDQLNINFYNFKFYEKRPLEYACIGGSLKCVKLVLKNQSKWSHLDSSVSNAIKYACQQGYPLILRELLEFQKQKDCMEFHPKCWLINGTDNDKEIYKLLHKYGVSAKLFCYFKLFFIFAC